MDSTLLSGQGTPMVPSKACSLTSLLERGIECTRRGAYIEGATFFALAREQLTSGQEHLAVLLDAFLQSHTDYWQAQQALHEASRRFVEADIEHQTHLLTLEKLPQTFNEEATAVAQIHAEAQSTKISKEQQPYRSAQQTLASAHHTDRSEGEPSPLQLLLTDGVALPELYITCFGRFEIRQLDRPIVLCHSRNGRAIIRFLAAQMGYRASVDKLMDVLWAQDTPDIARHKLQVAISAARRSLNSGYHCDPGEGYILYKDGFYQFNPSVTVRTDVDEFLSLWQAGRQTKGSESMALYERACNLCSGPFLVEDMYADWSAPRREQLKDIYVTMCHALAISSLEAGSYEDAVKWTSAILREDRCDEAAHRQLILIYAAQGRRSEALQQFYRCERILSTELGVSPMPETIAVLQTILNSADLPSSPEISV